MKNNILSKIFASILLSIALAVTIEAQNYGRVEIDKFCKNNTTLTKHGIQINGQKANATIMQLSAGKYRYPDGGALLLFLNNHYVLKLPRTYKSIGKGYIYGTDGRDLLGGGGIVAGCSKEQLSEAVKKNNLHSKGFTLVKLYR